MGQPIIASRHLKNPQLDLKKGLLYFNVNAVTKPCDAGTLMSQTRYVASGAFKQYVTGLGFRRTISGILLNRMNITSPNNQWRRICRNKARMAVVLSHYGPNVLKAIAKDFGVTFAALKATISKQWTAHIKSHSYFNAYSSTKVRRISVGGRKVTRKEIIRETYRVPHDAIKWVRALDKLMKQVHFSLTKRRKIWKSLGGKEKILKAQAVKRTYQLLLREVQKLDRESAK